MLIYVKKAVLFIFPVFKWSAIINLCLLILIYFIKHDSRSFNIDVLTYLAIFEFLTLVIYLILYRVKWVDKWGNPRSNDL